MNYKEISKGIISAVTLLAMSILLVYFLWQIRFVVGYIFIAFAISLMGRPIMTFLAEKNHLSTTLSAFITIFLMFMAFTAFFAVTIPLAIEQAENLSLLDTHQLQNSIADQIKIIDESLKNKHIHIFDDNYAKLLTPNSSFKIHKETLQSGFAFLGKLGVSVFAIVFISFFF